MDSFGSRAPRQVAYVCHYRFGAVVFVIRLGHRHQENELRMALAVRTSYPPGAFGTWTPREVIAYYPHVSQAKGKDASRRCQAWRRIINHRLRISDSAVFMAAEVDASFAKERLTPEAGERHQSTCYASLIRHS